MSVSVTFLGGLGEIGRNCAMLEIGGRIALIDCGMMFPEEDMLGVDLVLPDFGSVFARAGASMAFTVNSGRVSSLTVSTTEAGAWASAEAVISTV